MDSSCADVEGERLADAVCPFAPTSLCPLGCGRTDGASTSLTVEAGQFLARAGERLDFVPALRTGVMSSSLSLRDGRRQVTGFHYPGAALPVCWPLPVAQASVRAVTACVVCRIGQDELRAACHADTAVADRLLAQAHAAIAEGLRHMVVLGRKTASEKVASFVLATLRAAGRQTPQGWLLDLPMGREDIADHLGIKVETVSRAFTRLKTAGVLALPAPNRAIVSDLRPLMEAAGESEPFGLSGAAA